MKYRPNRKYCCDKCRLQAYYWNHKRKSENEYGPVTPSGMSGEDAAQYLVQIKSIVARMGALRGRGDEFGDRCASAAVMIEDDLKEMGL